jgi:hypothetical protein
MGFHSFTQSLYLYLSVCSLHYGLSGERATGEKRRKGKKGRRGKASRGREKKRESGAVLERKGREEKEERRE